MHAVTNTQSKKGNGLGMANVMYDKNFFDFCVFLSSLTPFLFCRSLDKYYSFLLVFLLLFYRIWTAFVLVYFLLFWVWNCYFRDRNIIILTLN
ncbi:hypothetical protein V8C35DRAFT_56578 [Trichoderma chlorosporum]